jgi:hypothetical protein
MKLRNKSKKPLPCKPKTNKIIKKEKLQKNQKLKMNKDDVSSLQLI